MNQQTVTNANDRRSYPPAALMGRVAGRLFSIALLVLLWAAPAPACVGKALTIGIVNSPQEIIYAELIAQMVTERTGTTVDIHTYKDINELYDAVKKGEAGIIIENTERGLHEVSLRPAENGRKTYEALKQEYRDKLDLVWLEPVASNGGDRYYAPVILVETMKNLPALPKVINRLSGALNAESYAKLALAVQDKEPPRKVARDFLKTKKLI